MLPLPLPLSQLKLPKLADNHILNPKPHTVRFTDERSKLQIHQYLVHKAPGTDDNNRRRTHWWNELCRQQWELEHMSSLITTRSVP